MKVVIAGASGPVGQSLLKVLKSEAQVLALTSKKMDPVIVDGVSWLSTNGFSISDMEVGLAGAEVVVFLTRARKSGQLTQARLEDLDVLLTETLAQAVRRTRIRRIVFYACGPFDGREEILKTSGREVVVFRGATEAAENLKNLVLQKNVTSIASDEVIYPGKRSVGTTMKVCSVQRLPNPNGHSAESLASDYFDWLPKSVPFTSVVKFESTVSILFCGIAALKLRRNQGRSSKINCWFDVLGGAFAKSPQNGYFEFRTLSDGSSMVVLSGFVPSLPWPIYRLSQALVHQWALVKFGVSLSKTKALPAS